MKQLKFDEQVNWVFVEDGNSIAILVRHLAGNMRSRWSNFLVEDGEKPDRHRDMEFDLRAKLSLDEVFVLWEEGWEYLWKALDELSIDDLCLEVRIRGKPLLVFDALLRQLAHYGNHVGQITLLCKMLLGRDWLTLTIPRKKEREV